MGAGPGLRAGLLAAPGGGHGSGHARAARLVRMESRAAAAAPGRRRRPGATHGQHPGDRQRTHRHRELPGRGVAVCGRSSRALLPHAAEPGRTPPARRHVPRRRGRAASGRRRVLLARDHRQRDRPHLRPAQDPRRDQARPEARRTDVPLGERPHRVGRAPARPARRAAHRQGPSLHLHEPEPSPDAGRGRVHDPRRARRRVRGGPRRRSPVATPAGPHQGLQRAVGVLARRHLLHGQRGRGA